MKRNVLIICCLSIVMLCLFSFNADASQVKGVYVDGDKVHFNNNPVIIDGMTFVEFRPIFEKLGLNVKWDQSTRTIYSQQEGLNIKMQIGNKTITKNYTDYIYDAPRILYGNTFVPLRAVSELANKNIRWDKTSRIVYIEGVHPEPILTPTYTNPTPKKQDEQGFVLDNGVALGMSVQQVLKKEFGRLLESTPSSLLFRSIYNGFDVIVDYNFNQDKLYKVTYLFSHEKSSFLDQVYVDNFFQLERIISNKYGSPTGDILVWEDEIFKNIYEYDYDNWGLCVSIGYLKGMYVWEMEDVKVNLVMGNHDLNVNLGLVFQQK